MKTDLLPGETIVRDGAANLQRGIETVGGQPFLTNIRLVFEAHQFNIQTGITIIPLPEILDTTFCWTKFLNVLPVTPNSLSVSTSTGEQHRFVLFGRKNGNLQSTTG